MKFLLFIMMLPTLCLSQQLYEKSDKVFNVYRRDSAIINTYNIEYAKGMKTADSVITNEITSAYISKSYKNKPCLGDVQLFVRLDFESKDNRAKLTFNEVFYKSEKDNCPQTGTLVELLECKKCGLSSDFIKNDYIKFIEIVYQDYHKFLKKKSDDGNW